MAPNDQYKDALMARLKAVLPEAGMPNLTRFDGMADYFIWFANPYDFQDGLIIALRRDNLEIAGYRVKTNDAPNFFSADAAVALARWVQSPDISRYLVRDVTFAFGAGVGQFFAKRLPGWSLCEPERKVPENLWDGMT